MARWKGARRFRSWKCPAAEYLARTGSVNGTKDLHTRRVDGQEPYGAKGSIPDRVSRVLSEYGKLVESEIERFIPRRIPPDNFSKPIWDLLDRGGKRFRPSLTFLACKAVGGDAKRAKGGAVAVELLHNMTLIHDDIEDESQIRRGEPCIHLIYGIPPAINVGDAMLIKVFEAASSGGLSDSVKLRLVRQIARRAYQLTHGQSFEFTIRDHQRFDEHDVDNILRSKTGALIALSAEVGAIAGDATHERFRALSRFGENIGIGFQIMDDLLNVDSSSQRYGKELGGDIREGKKTVMAAHLIRKLKPEHRKRFLSLLGRRDISDNGIREAISLYKRYGSIEYARVKAHRFVSKGIKELAALPPSKAKNELCMVAQFLVERNF